MNTAETVALAILSSGVVAAVVSGVMTDRWERRRTFRERRINAAGDFVSAAGRANNAVTALAQEIHSPIPPAEQIDALLARCDQADKEIDAALERVGLVRILYGPVHPDISGNANLWANLAAASVKAACGWLWIAKGTARDPGTMTKQQELCMLELSKSREAMHDFEVAAAAAWDDSTRWWSFGVARTRT